SPVSHVKKARTPALILHGETDPIDPIGQGQQFYRGLKHYGVPCEFVLYPREGHGPQEEKHQIDVLQRVVRWCDSHVKDSQPAGRPTASAATSVPTEQYPYPECEKIVEDLKKNFGDPKIIEWLSRSEQEGGEKIVTRKKEHSSEVNPSGPRHKYVTIQVKFRARTKQGGF